MNSNEFLTREQIKAEAQRIVEQKMKEKQVLKQQ